jgi:phage shock protein C
MTQPARNPDERPANPHDALPHDERRARRPGTTVPLRRSKTDRKLGGVIGGIAEYVGTDARDLRLVVAVLILATGGVLAIVYALLWLMLPPTP